MDEHQRYTLPSDRAGGVGDLVAAAGTTVPDVALGATGWAREWTSVTDTLQAGELVPGATRLTRDVALEAVVGLNPANLSTRTIVRRGIGNSEAERVLYELQIDLATPRLRMRWERPWAEVDGPVLPSFFCDVPRFMFLCRDTWSTSVESAAIWVPPAPSLDGLIWVYVAAVREWRSPTDVLVSFYVDGQLLDEVETDLGDIEGGDGGTLLVGSTGFGDAVIGAMQVGDRIDSLRISRDVRTAEEIRQVYRRQFVFPVMGYELVKAMQPPGTARPTDPDSAFQRELMVEGGALAGAWHASEEQAEDFLPNRATALLPRWERVLGQAPGPSDKYSTRRERLTGFMRRQHGFSRDKIVIAVAELLRQEAEDVQIVEVVNRWTDDFGNGVISTAWISELGNGEILQETGGALQLQLDDGVAKDPSWISADDTRVSKATRLRTPLEALTGSEFRAQLKAGFSWFSGAPNGVITGIFLSNGVTGAADLFGIARDGGVTKYAHRAVRPGVAQVDTFGAAVNTSQVWLRVFEHGDGTASLYSSDAIDGPWTLRIGPKAIDAGVKWCGLFLTAGTGSAATVAGSIVDWEEWRAWVPAARAVFQWFIYRDPLLPGVADIEGAQLVIDKMKPAHTDGNVIESLIAICDDLHSVCDREPCA